MIIRIKTMQFAKLILFTITTFIVFQDSIACSGYKITIGDKTLFGSNHDAWFKTDQVKKLGTVILSMSGIVGIEFNIDSHPS